MGLKEKVLNIVKSEGADYFGVADLASAKEAIASQSGEEIASFPFAISIGIRMFDDIVDLLPKQKERWVRVTYRTSAYEVINARLDIAASKIAGVIRNEGYHAIPIASSKRVDSEKLCGAFSHKMAAHLAGLGWIGKSCLLITPEHGPRVRWVTVLTDAPLGPAGKPMDQRCGHCHECVDACPVHAFSGRNFVETEERNARYDAHKCEAYFDQQDETIGDPVCGMCVYICPHGRQERTVSRKE